MSSSNKGKLFAKNVNKNSNNLKQGAPAPKQPVGSNSRPLTGAALASKMKAEAAEAARHQASKNAASRDNNNKKFNHQPPAPAKKNVPVNVDSRKQPVSHGHVQASHKPDNQPPKDTKFKKTEAPAPVKDIKIEKKKFIKKEEPKNAENKHAELRHAQNVEKAKKTETTSELSRETLTLLFKEAKKASEKAYAPYSRFKVGAVLLIDSKDDSGQVSAYTGCNVENASYGMTCCAERIAVYKAISDGHSQFKALVLYASAKNPVTPCGACRQVLHEFASPDMKIYSVGEFRNEDAGKVNYSVYTVGELLPDGFKSSDFMKK